MISFGYKNRLFVVLSVYWLITYYCSKNDNDVFVAAAMAMPRPRDGSKILLVGATGGTGGRVLNGFLDVGFRPQQIRLLTRNPNKPSLQIYKNMGFDLFEGNLQDSASVTNAVEGCWGCYVHSLSSDTKKLDTNEVDCAKNLAEALVQMKKKKTNLQHVIYNSAAGEADHGVDRTQQKQDAEQVFLEAFVNNVYKFTSLRANLFMEELWKTYTRPAILKGNFPFGVKPDRQIYLTSVRDMGRLAGACFLKPPKENVINVAGDVLSASEIAAAFAKAQGSPCVHKQGRLLVLMARLFFRDLYQQIRFYRKTTETTDILGLQTKFPNTQLTDFEQFLTETDWGNPDLTFDNLTIATD